MDNPELYSVNNQHQKVRIEEFIKVNDDKLKNAFDGKEIAVLDIGSGCGTILSEVIVGNSGLKFSKVIGIDISEEMVKFSNEKYGSDLISFHVMDAAKEIPEIFKNLKFDLITSFFCMQWINNFDIAFQNVQNFLNPNGIFCCVFMQFTKAVIKELMESKDDYVKQLIDYDNLQNFRLLDDPTEVIKKLLNDNGMEIVNITDLEEDEFVFDDLKAVQASFEVSAPNLGLLPESEKPKVYEKMFKMFGLKQKNDKFALNARTVSFIARKSE
ncbi:hypothetical protein ACKWTF_013248 [Chironomus riparius]